MPDVVAAPQDAVVADAHERLDDVALEDEAVLAHLGVAPDEGARADIGGEPVAAAFGVPVQARAQAVELAGRDRDEHVDLGRRIVRLQRFPGHHRTTRQQRLREVVALDAEGDHVTVAVVLEVFAGDLRELAGADKD